jgi:hypothetical protein
MFFPYNVTVCDTTPGWYNGTTGTYTPLVAGFYQVTAMARIYSNGSPAYLSLSCNGTQIASNGNALDASNGIISTLVYMNGTTDFLRTYITSGNTAGFAITQTAANARLAIMLMIPT